MNRQEIISEIREFLNGYLEERGFVLVDLIYRYEGRDLVLRILADRPEGGISIEECAVLNHEISGILDQRQILQESYLLEVSSPGLDRPLRTKNDFSRCLNRDVRVFLAKPIGNKIEWQGRIHKADDTNVFLETEKGVIQIPLENIAKAKQVITNI